MAEELQYSSDIGSNKRKYDEQEAPPPPRRPTGFSAPISSASSDDQGAISYNSVPPPSADDVDAQVKSAKQRAQEIASRLLYNAGLGAGTGAGVGGYEAKRVRVDNGGGFDSPIQDKAPINSAPSAIPVYNYQQNSSKKIDVPNGRVGVIIGKSGETIKSLQLQSGAKIQVTRDMDADRTSLTRPVELMGTPDQIARAEQLINDVLAEAEAGGSGVGSRRPTSHQPGSDQFVMRIPNNKVGLVIGKGGETIKSMQASTGARIQVVPLHPPPGDTSTERSVHIDGTPEQIEAAKQLVNEAISENRMRNSSMGGGGYNQQQGYQARPQTNWGAAPQMQQAGGYGYVQPGAYPGAPQYASQGQYGGYPQAAAAGGGYGANWDQSSAAQTAQQQGASGGYDYYGQQQQAPSQQQSQNPSGQGDESGGGGYNYNSTSQAPAASSYPQQGSYGYGGYGAQSGYYDQGGYGSAAGYGGAQDGSGYGAAQGGDSTKPPAATAGYGVPPATSQGGYGPPSTTQKPAAYGTAGGYGQSQQSPTTAPGGGGGYGQAPPPGASYPQAPSSGGGYAGAPAYGGPPPPGGPQSGYGQYGGGYGSSGYHGQPPASYYGDASAKSATAAAAAAPPASQTSAAPPKASPKS